MLFRSTPPKYSVYLGKKECILQSMDINIYTVWREERLQEADEKLREIEEAKKREAKAAAIPVVADRAALVLVPIQSTVVAGVAAIPVVSTDHNVDVHVVDVQPVFDDVAAEDDSKPRTVPPEGGRMIRHLLCVLYIFCSLLLMLSRDGCCSYSCHARRRSKT